MRERRERKIENIICESERERERERVRKRERETDKTYTL